MLSYFSEQLAGSASRGLINRVTDVKLLQGDLAEAWRLTSSPSLTRKSFELIFISSLSTWLLPRSNQRLEARDHVEKFFVDATLAQLVEGAAKLLQQIVDVFIRALHCRKAARILAG
jgi:hypothetical protein